MKKLRKLILITAITAIAGITLAACGSTEPPDVASGAQSPAAVQESSRKDLTPAKVEMIEVDIKNLPKGITKEDLVKEDGKYYLDQTKFKELALKAGKNLTIQAVNGFAYTASAKGNMVTGVAVSDEAKTESAKQAGTTETANNSNNKSGQTNAGGTNTNHGGPGANANSNHGNTGTGANTNHGSTGSNTNSGSGNTGGSSSSGSSTPAQPAHEHIWQAVYRTETTDQGWYEDDYDYRPVCNVCGGDLSGLDSMAQLDHLGNCKSGYSVVAVKVGQHWVSNPVSNQVLDHYVCLTCGATK